MLRSHLRVRAHRISGDLFLTLSIAVGLALTIAACAGDWLTDRNLGWRAASASLVGLTATADLPAPDHGGRGHKSRGDGRRCVADGNRGNPGANTHGSDGVANHNGGDRDDGIHPCRRGPATSR